MKKMTPLNSLFWFWTAMVAGFITGFIGISLEAKPVVVIGILIVAGAIIFHFIFYRCPHCGKFLDRSRGFYCPFCGGELD